MALKLFKKHKKIQGESPGTIVYTGEAKDTEIKVELITYDKESFSERKLSFDEISTVEEKPGIKWINVIGIHNPSLLEKIGNIFNIHPLVLEDIANTSQQPKIEDYSDLIYVVLKMFYVNPNNEITIEHINFILKKNILISFQETNIDVFNPVRNRLGIGRKKLRGSNSDYLLYALIDTIVDNYFVILQKIGEKIETLKKSITSNPTKDNLIILDTLQEEVMVIQNLVEPLRKILPELAEFDSALIEETNSFYFRDLQDHIIQVSNSMISINDKLSSMNDYYLSAISHRTNEVMKTLALVATICVPITVIAGVYGMNFQNMPELSSPYGYPVVLGAMATVGLSLYGYFKKKKWL